MQRYEIILIFALKLIKMNMDLTKQQVWNSAAKDGAVLASITIGAGLINLLTGKIFQDGAVVVTMVISMAVWAARLIGSYTVLRNRIRRFGQKSAQPERSFGYGVKVTLLSSILCAAFVAIDLLYLSSGTLSSTWDQMMQLYGSKMDSNSMKMLESMKEYLPLYSTISQFVWMFLIGIIFSATISSAEKKAALFRKTEDSNQ